MNNLTNLQWTLEGKAEDMKLSAQKNYYERCTTLKKELQACLDITSDNMKAQHNQSILTFKIGEMVYLNAKNIKE
jgi:hypothetical protein